MNRLNRFLFCAIGTASIGLVVLPGAQAVMFTVRPGTVFARKPSYKAADRLSIDVSIARGLDYYTGTVIETFLNQLPEIGSVCSGGVALEASLQAGGCPIGP